MNHRLPHCLQLSLQVLLEHAGLSTSAAQMATYGGSINGGTFDGLIIRENHGKSHSTGWLGGTPISGKHHIMAISPLWFELWGSIFQNKGTAHCMTLDDTRLSLRCGGRPSLKPAGTAGWTARNLWKEGHIHTWIYVNIHEYTWTFCWLFEHIQMRFAL